ncbi:MAG: GAF domain-containing protein [Balneolaceae bacterium]
MVTNREDRALREFKHVLNDIVYLFRKALEADTIYLNWVNRSREQFVLESNSTTLPNVMFQDRIQFKQHFLEAFKDLVHIKQLEIGKDLREDSLKHYYDFVPVRYVTIVPFQNNGETVALTCIETEREFDVGAHEIEIAAYKNALTNVLNTYLEITDLYKDQKDWSDYEAGLQKISPRMHRVDIIDKMLSEIQKLLPTGGAYFLARGMESWVTVLSAKFANHCPPAGLALDDKTIAYDALHKGNSEFVIHFNQNPKQISRTEDKTEGATLAIPFIINDRRHGVLVANDLNPLVFKESIKHQISNLVRIASLTIQVNLEKIPVDKDLLTSEYGSFIPELWEKTLERQIERFGIDESSTWFGYVAINNMQELRSRYRLEDLKKLQKVVVNTLNPVRFGMKGFVGFSSDYVYSYVLQGSEKDHEKWIKVVSNSFDEPLSFHDGRQFTVEINMGYTMISSGNEEVHEVIKKAKSSLANALKQDQNKSVKI